MTIETASFRMLSPKMIVYSLAASLVIRKVEVRVVRDRLLTIYFVSIEDSQDGHRVCSRQSRAENQALQESEFEAFEPQERPYVHQNPVASRSRKGQYVISKGKLVTYPSPTAEMNVPRNANVRIVPKFRKKFSYRC
jgi:hypothetical protein